MACWQEEMTTILRILINDLNTSAYTYTDHRLSQLICVAAQHVQEDLGISTYTISVGVPSISADPVDAGDSTFVALTTLKAGCLLDISAARTRAGLEGIKARLGPSELAINGSIDGFLKLLDKGFCETYSQMRLSYICNDVNRLKSVISCFNSNAFNTLYQLPSSMGRQGRDGVY